MSASDGTTPLSDQFNFYIGDCAEELYRAEGIKQLESVEKCYREMPFNHVLCHVLMVENPVSCGQGLRVKVTFIGYEPGEPTSMLDPIATVKIMEMLRETVRRARGVLFISPYRPLCADRTMALGGTC